MTPSIVQWNYPSLYCIKPEVEEKRYKGLIAHTNARTRTSTFGNDYSTLVTTFLLRCIYLRFLDSMFRFELWGQTRKTWQTATELDRLADLGLPSRNKPSRYGHTPSCVKVCYVSTTAHLSRSFPPWLPWQIFWLFKNLSRRSRRPRRATFVDPVPLHCVTVTPFRPRWPKLWLPWPPGT